ncbi:helix-turn-helix domain-containing protein [Armatimonas sp.]|uniref:helix-turn-helix domain-containing protein n=1 Tax=Armatimonas sp. TaxID=1872638 RepID=UPI00374DD3FC
MDPQTLGARIQRIRQRQNFSVRDLADKAGVNKNTILRLEKGLTPSYSTLNRVCEALGVHVAQLTQPEPDEDQTIALHARAQEGREPLAADESVLLSSLRCRLPGGRVNAAIMELYGESESTTHPGEELVFCLRGSAKVAVAGRTYELGEGDAATFWSAERHSYGPADDAAEEQLPVILLMVWVDSRESERA